SLARRLRRAVRRPSIVPALKKSIYEQARGTDGDSRIGEIERWEIPGAPIEINEVDHVAMDDAVDHVAERPAQHQRQADRQNGLIRADPPQPDHQGHADDDREDDEEPSLP